MAVVKPAPTIVLLWTSNKKAYASRKKARSSSKRRGRHRSRPCVNLRKRFVGGGGASSSPSSVDGVSSGPLCTVMDDDGDTSLSAMNDMIIS